jgi:hypothetical protein
MTTDLPSPHTTLAILLGASRYPKYATWGENPAFARSAQAFKEYLCSKFRLDEFQILDLFDSDDHADELTEQIAEFLRLRVAQIEDPAGRPRDVIVHYVGHGFFDKDHDSYCLSLNRTNARDELTSSLPASSLRRAIDNECPRLRRYYILDACFAQGALKSWQADDSALWRKFWEGPAPEGCALFSAASERDVALCQKGSPSSLFTGALLQVLHEGDAEQDGPLTLRQVWRLTREAVHTFPMPGLPPEGRPMPHLDLPRQDQGDVADVPLFPNPKSCPVVQETIEETAARVLGNYQRFVQTEWRSHWSEVDGG